MTSLSNALARLNRPRLVPMWRIAFCVAITAVCTMSLLPGDALPPLPDVSDKLEHAVAYAALATLGALAWNRGRAFGGVLAAVILLGGTIEILQIWIPGRSGEWLDFVADTVGALVGAAPFAAGRSPPARA